MKADTLIREALREDLGRRGDVTTKLFIPLHWRLKARVAARQAGVVCGVKIAAAIFTACDRTCRVSIVVPDGGRVKPGQTVLKISGGRGILTAERTALNFLQRLSGVATLTAAFVAAVRGTRAKIYDTRKTLPGWRELEKYAVRCGGGMNHRLGLYDGVMAKDNHWLAARDFDRAARLSKRLYPRLPLIIEADRLDQVRRALKLSTDIILLDNMPRPRLRKAIRLIRRSSPKTRIEISGGVNLKTARPLAKLGVDRISVGQITHSAPALDLGLDLE